MITPNVTGMSPRNLHAYKGLQYYNKMPDKIKKFSKARSDTRFFGINFMVLFLSRSPK